MENVTCDEWICDDTGNDGIGMEDLKFLQESALVKRSETRVFLKNSVSGYPFGWQFKIGHGGGGDRTVAAEETHRFKMDRFKNTCKYVTNLYDFYRRWNMLGSFDHKKSTCYVHWCTYI